VFRNSSAQKLVGRVAEIDPLSQKCVTLLKSWISDCIETHQQCPRYVLANLPTRVLDLGAPGISGLENRLKLHCTTSQQKGAYVALSHCWGDKVPLTTTQSTFGERTRHIDFGQLPKSFQDAVRVTRKLEYRYLWIDSLCIIQDDPNDWARESRRMGDIYKKSILIVSAKSAVDSI
jgi:Heterokaryon incompatibility protein (HET)